MQSLTNKELKKILRREFIKKRDSIYPATSNEYSEIICETIISGKHFTNAKNVLLYASYGSEVKTDPLLNKALLLKKNVYFPKVCGDDMDFYKINSKNDLRDGFKGILEPYGASPSYSSGNSRDTIIIVPGSVFGRTGYRIGYGRGFYDRYFNRFKDMYKIGICFDIQLLNEVPFEEHDIMLDAIVTENEVLFRGDEGESQWI